MDPLDRYTRQRRLREVGDAGQERLARASLRIAGGGAALTELVYLHRAGVGAVELDAFARPAPFAHAAAFRHRAAARHAEGAWRALSAMFAELRGHEGGPS